jgi:hypothetical protein
MKNCLIIWNYCANAVCKASTSQRNYIKLRVKMGLFLSVIITEIFEERD